MLRFKAHDWATVCFRLERLQGDSLSMVNDDGEDDPAKSSEWRDTVRAILDGVRFYSDKAGLDAAVGQCERISKQSDDTPTEALCYLLRDLEGTIQRELRKPLVLMLRTDLSPFYDDEDKAFWGAKVSRRFSRATYDIAEARRCFALERWDGCVHHLMCATEHALRRWAKNLRLQTKKHIDEEDQQQILAAAEKERQMLLNAAKTKRRDKRLKYVSETLGHFGFIKDAYRNYSAHGKERYDERKAKNLMTHIEAFMRLLAQDV